MGILVSDRLKHSSEIIKYNMKSRGTDGYVRGKFFENQIFLHFGIRVCTFLNLAFDYLSVLEMVLLILMTCLILVNNFTS